MRLNMEQRRIIELEPSGHMLIKGVAGSGKTTVAVRRVGFLKEHYCPEPDDHILLVTFNKTLLQYIQYQYENLADHHISQQSFFGSNAAVEITNIDSLMFAYFFRYCRRNNVTYKIAQRHDSRTLLQQAILQVQKQFPRIDILSLKNILFLLDEIEWIKACDIPDLETYQQIDRIGRSEGGSGNPQKLLKNSQIRESIYTLMETFDQLLLKKGLVDFKTMNKLALQEAETNVTQPFTHIIIDESQDLSKVQLRFIQLLHQDKSYASIMFVADNTQSIYSQSWLGKGRPYTTIGYDMSGKARTLSKNYRTTTEISRAAYSLIENDEHIKNNIDFVQPALIDRHGHAPIYRFFLQREKQTDFLINEIKKLQSDYDLRDICIVARNNRIIDDYAQSLKEVGIPSLILNAQDPCFDSDSVKLVTMHSIKGLEFKVIFLIHLDEGVIPIDNGFNEREMLTEERKLMYVGMTRANELLYMSSVRKPSSFIMEVDHTSLRFQNGMTLRPFRSVPIKAYKLTDQVIDINGKEEAVRQWFINELIESYGYPLELIEFEYPVQQFSRRGYVDVAISIEVNGESIPYIFAEIKAFGTGIDNAIGQLRSYMQANRHVRYGIATDGIEIVVIEANGEKRIDIPPCQPQFLPNTKIERTYKNLRNRKTYDYLQQIDDKANIDIADAQSELILDVDCNVEVPLIGNVVAGIPTTASEYFEEMIFLPKEWIMNEEDTFALRVTGDSMVDADIDKNDIVIVHRQEVATNGDIVIAVINDEATMKKYMQMGSDILLISENSAYEPITMNPADVRINGKVIGILKQ